jgi:hypothetical protein
MDDSHENSHRTHGSTPTVYCGACVFFCGSIFIPRGPPRRMTDSLKNQIGLIVLQIQNAFDSLCSQPAFSFSTAIIRLDRASASFLFETGARHYDPGDGPSRARMVVME